VLHRLLLLLGLALCGMADAAAQARIDLTATPAWKGWSRPGRSSEVDIRLSTDTATAAAVDVVAGRQSAHTELDLQPGRTLRLHIPVGSADRVVVSVRPSAGKSERRELRIAQSESPVLGVATAAGGPVDLDGFHTVALTADDLPRNASAHSSIDALILDAPTLAGLDQRQLGALLGRATSCGRIVVVNTDPQVRRLLDGAGECGGPALMSAATLAEAVDQLKTSLAQARQEPMALGGIGELLGPDHAAWNRVAVVLAIYFAATALVLMFTARLPFLLLTPGLFALVGFMMLHVATPPTQLVVWSEGTSGTQLARYQAWHQLSGLMRERTRARIPPQLSANAQPCDANQTLRLEFDAKSGQATTAEFETRLFRQVSLCYSGSFPMSRAIGIEARDGGMRDVSNTGPMAWPQGMLLLDGQVHDLPAIGPNARITLAASGGHPPEDAVQRVAMARKRTDKVAALWQLELGGVAEIPVDSRGWLLVTVPTP
jgi:hypothetical protein